jgi:hypothetical protein
MGVPCLDDDQDAMVRGAEEVRRQGSRSSHCYVSSGDRIHKLLFQAQWTSIREPLIGMVVGAQYP